jgi:hypothetical protein
MSRRANRLEWVEINAAMRMQMTCWWKKKEPEMMMMMMWRINNSRRLTEHTLT